MNLAQRSAYFKGAEALTFSWNLETLETGYGRYAWPSAQLRLELRQEQGVTLGHRLDASVGKISYPAGELEMGGQPPGEMTEPDSLHGSRDEVAASHRRWRFRSRQIPMTMGSTEITMIPRTT